MAGRKIFLPDIFLLVTSLEAEKWRAEKFFCPIFFCFPDCAR
jgi:hypothetical protein